jgi:RNA polymerase sigma factor (sigma-70 family)
MATNSNGKDQNWKDHSMSDPAMRVSDALRERIENQLRRTALSSYGEDACSEALLRLVESPPQLESAENLAGYIYRASRNIGVNAMKRDKWIRANQMSITERFESNQDRVDEESSEKISEVFRMLPEEEGTVIQLMVFDGLSAVRTGEVMGISRRQVPLLLARALGLLRRKLVEAMVADPHLDNSVTRFLGS